MMAGWCLAWWRALCSLDVFSWHSMWSRLHCAYSGGAGYARLPPGLAWVHARKWLRSGHRGHMELMLLRVFQRHVVDQCQIVLRAVPIINNAVGSLDQDSLWVGLPNVRGRVGESV
jgi:hypothetical protein